MNEQKEKVITTTCVSHCGVLIMLIALIDHPERPHFNLSSLKRITYAGSPTPVERIREALEVFGPVLDESYGQAKSIITITHLSGQEHVLNDGSAPERRLASAGREYPGVQVRIVDDNDQVLAPDELAEVVTRSDVVMRGYWNQPDKTEEALNGGWLHTGDIGYLDEDGYLFLVDRKTTKLLLVDSMSILERLRKFYRLTPLLHRKPSLV